ncbi:TPA: hypothetical protein JZG45_004855 [Escherichia coli]|nr:hypothetical protein [Escherichia coli]
MMKVKVLHYIQEKRLACSTRDIAVQCGISAYQARYYLVCLEKEGRISRTPFCKGARTLWKVSS